MRSSVTDEDEVIVVAAAALRNVDVCVIPVPSLLIDDEADWSSDENCDEDAVEVIVVEDRPGLIPYLSKYFSAALCLIRSCCKCASKNASSSARSSFSSA